MISLDGEWEVSDDEGEFIFTGTVKRGTVLCLIIP